MTPREAIDALNAINQFIAAYAPHEPFDGSSVSAAATAAEGIFESLQVAANSATSVGVPLYTCHNKEHATLLAEELHAADGETYIVDKRGAFWGVSKMSAQPESEP